MALPMRNTRVRLCFDDPPPYHPRLVWYLVNLDNCKFVSDLESQIKSRFSLSRYTHVHLYVEEYLLPSNERIEVIRENDVIRVIQEAIQHEYLHQVGSEPKKKRKSATNAASEEDNNSQITNGERSLEKTFEMKKKKKQRDENQGKKKKKKETEPSRQIITTKDDVRKKKKKKKEKDREKLKRKRKEIESGSNQKSPETDTDSSCDEESSIAVASPTRKRKKRKTDSVKCSTSSSPQEKLTTDSSLKKVNSSKAKISTHKGQQNVVNHVNNCVSVGDLGRKTTFVKKNMASSTDNHIRFESDCSSESESDSESNSKPKSSVESSPIKESGSFDSTSKAKSTNNISQRKDKLSVSESVSSSSSSSSSSASSSSGTSSSSSDSEPACQNVSSVKQSDVYSTTNSVTTKSSQVSEPDVPINNREKTTQQKFGNEKTKPTWNNRSRRQLGKQEQLNTVLTNKSIIIEYPDEETLPTWKSGYSASFVSPPPAPPQQEYDKLQPLHGPPRVGDKIAYKILELSATYNPEVSEYKEAVVTSFLSETQEMELEITHDPSVCDMPKPGKFDVVYNDDSEDMEDNGPVDNDSSKVTVSWLSMIEPKLIT